MNAVGRGTLAVLATLALAAGCGRTREHATPATHAGAPVIVISIDTMRADRLSPWGYAAAHTPNIERLAADGIVFRNASSHVPLTLPSHLSIMTGLLPAAHGVRDNIGYSLRRDVQSLPQSLRKGGYATGAAVSAYVLRGSTGMASLFDSYDDAIPLTGGTSLGSLQRPGEQTAAAAAKWIAPRGSSPFFFFLHLFEPHAPYDPPEPFRSASNDPYDGEIAHADAIVGGFLEELRKSGVYDRAIIVLLSDHGEGLGDHGEKEHGIFVYREAIHVPLIVKLPSNARAGEVVERAVGLIDVFPTILALLGSAPPQGIDGVSLFDDGPRRIFSESLYPRLHFGWSDLRSLTDGDHHYIDAPRSELYSLKEDPSEKKNIADSDRRTGASFRQELEKYDRRLAAPSAVSPEEAAKLAALGYVSAPAGAPAGELLDPKDGIGQLAAFETAKDALAKGEVDRAIDGFRSVLAQNPNFTDAAARLAGAYEQAGRFDEAAQTWQAMLARNPATVEQAVLGIGTAMLNAGRFDEARRHAELALGRNPAAANLLLARIALAAGKPAEAVSHARAAASEPYYAADAVMVQSEALMRSGSGGAEEALRVLDELKRARTARGEGALRSLEIARAGVLMRQSRTAEAMAALREEIRLFPRERDTYGRLAAIHLLQKDPAGAESVLNALVAADPSAASYALAAKTLAHFGYAGAAAEWRRRGAQAESGR